MADSTNPSVAGQINNAGDILALHRTKIQETLIKFYIDNLKASKFFQKRTISNGSGAEFMLLGNTTAQYVEAGTERLGTNKVAHNKITVLLDNFLSTDIFIRKDDEKMWNRDDLRQQYLEQMGIALALADEKMSLQVGVNAARSSSPITGGESGTVLNNVNMATDASVLGAAIFDAARRFKEKNVNTNDCKLFMSPLQYSILAQNTDFINKNYGGAGAIKDGTIFKIAGIDIEETNCLPSTNVTADALQRGTDYAGDFTDTVALIATPRAIGQVELIGVESDVEVQKAKHGCLLMASGLQGKGVVNPRDAIELSKSV